MLKRESTLEMFNYHKLSSYSDIKMRELQYTTKINLRGDSHDKNFMSAAGEILNNILPTKANTYTIQENIKIIWLSPNEWLITEENENNKNRLLDELNNAVGSVEASVTDVSENRTVIRINGKQIFTLLAKFLVLDLEKNFSKVESVAQTLFVKVPVLLVRVHLDNQEPTIDIITNRSHANYIIELLVDGTKNIQI